MDEDHRNSRAAAPAKCGDVAEELAYRLRQQKLTAAFGEYALRARDVTDMLQEASRVCALGLNSQFCKVMEYLPTEGRFLVKSGVGWRDGVVGHARVGADAESPTGYAFQTGEPVISNHLSKETRFRTPSLLAEHGIRRAINVLIQGDGDRYGVLEVDSPNEGWFSPADLAFLQGFANLIGVALERHRVEEALRASEARLQDALTHQEILTREISHRVKNSLAMVAGLLGMQRHAISDPGLARVLDDAQGRVMTIAQVHDQLWRANEVHMVDLAPFMGALCTQLREAAGPGLSLECDFAPVKLVTDQAIPLALLANELVTNAFKYAYSKAGGSVQVTIRVIDPGQLRLTVCDRGRGLPAGFDAAEASSLGMTLIAGMARQLRGRSEWQDAQPGTCYVLDFAAQQDA